GGAGCFRSLVDIFHYPFPLYRLFFCPANRVWGQSRGRVRGAGLLEGPTKNGKPRLIAVSRTMSGVLDALRQWHLETQGEIIEDALLFVNENGSAPDPATFTHWLRRFYDRNGFSREFHVHTLRHYAITTMLAEGISKQTVAEIAGHASTDFLERTYCHPQMESRMLAAERLSNVLFPS
ncbi:MAG: site-specific integrase, partial [Clostridiales bacterium]|nr:site-specific integrase [Clostridiales bacterium]